MLIVLLSFSVISSWFMASASGQEMDMRNMPKYDQRYEYLDVDAILDSKRLVKNYVDCLVNVKPCTPEGKALRRILPEALRTKCVRCSERQKKVAVKVIHRIKSEYPEEWTKLASRWDPSGDFTRYFEDFLAKESFNTIVSGNEPVPSVTPAPAEYPPYPPPRVTMSTSAVTITPASTATPPKPLILNRFGETDEAQSQGSPSTVQQPSTMRPAPVQPTTRPATYKPMSTTQSRPVSVPWTGAASDPMPTRFPLRPLGPLGSETPPLYSTTVTLIEHLSSKFIRTTELVSDLLRNTVRAVVGV